jgi:hypothetical protein
MKTVDELIEIARDAHWDAYTATSATALEKWDRAAWARFAALMAIEYPDQCKICGERSTLDDQKRCAECVDQIQFDEKIKLRHDLKSAEAYAARRQADKKAAWLKWQAKKGAGDET